MSAARRAHQRNREEEQTLDRHQPLQHALDLQHQQQQQRLFSFVLRLQRIGIQLVLAQLRSSDQNRLLKQPKQTAAAANEHSRPERHLLSISGDVHAQFGRCRDFYAHVLPAVSARGGDQEPEADLVRFGARFAARAQSEPSARYSNRGRRLACGSSE